MKTRSLYPAALAALLALGTASPAFAQPEGGDRPERDGPPPPPPRQPEAERGDRPERDAPPPPPRDGGGERADGKDAPPTRRVMQALFRDIDLTDAQRQSLRLIHEERKDQGQAIRAELREAHEARDRDAMRAAAEKMRSFLQETHELMSAELTEEQRPIFEANVEAIRERMQDRRERRGEGPRGERRERGDRGEENKRAEREGGDRPRRSADRDAPPATQPAE